MGFVQWENSNWHSSFWALWIWLNLTHELRMFFCHGKLFQTQLPPLNKMSLKLVYLIGELLCFGHLSLCAGLYYGITIAIVSLATAMTSFTLNIHHKGSRGVPVPGVVKFICFDVLARVLCLRIHSLFEQACWKQLRRLSKFWRNAYWYGLHRRSSFERSERGVKSSRRIWLATANFLYVPNMMSLSTSSRNF